MATLALHAYHGRLAARFAAAGIEDADGEARLLLCHVLGCSFSRFFLEADRPVGAAEYRVLEEAARRRLDREPLAYILGSREFYGRDFTVTPAVLIPRPETELLVEQAVAWWRAMPAAGGRILDCGTGSGAIAVTLALELAACSVYAVDVAADALAVAAGNARRHRAEIVPVRADLRRLPFAAGAFRCIVANLPYIPSGEIAGLMPEVAGFEPRLALDGGPTGTELFSEIFPGLDAALVGGGGMFFEIGHDQEDFFHGFFRARPGYHACRVLRDYAGLPRLVQVLKR
ncbi:MAG: peptide chain release factor N(5)-glutamine methyltransferase [Thermodesulfobacteriota bacterium]